MTHCPWRRQPLLPPTMLWRPRLSGFIEPCLPSPCSAPPSGDGWLHEFKHDDYRLMVWRDGADLRLYTRNGHDWTDRFPSIVAAARALKPSVSSSRAR
jgi:ATP-dependent DNA ligase